MFYKETNFKETSIGKIPKEWKTVRLGEVITYVKGKKPKITMEECREEALPYLSTDYLRNGKPTQFVKITGDEIIVGDGEVVLLWDGSNAGEFFLGKNGVLSSTMVCLKLEKDYFDKLFLFYLLKKKERFLKGRTKGTGVPHVDKNVLRNIILPLPHIEEQRVVAEVLGCVDEAIRKTDEVIAKTERLKKGLMQELLTRGIGHKEFKQTPIGKIPKTWQVVELGNEDIVSQVTDGFHKSPTKDSNGVPLVKTENVIDGKIDFTNTERISIKDHEKEKSRCYPQYGDVLLTCVGTLGRTAVVETTEEFNIVRSVALLKPTEKLNRYFLHYVLNSIQSKRQMEALQTSTTRKGLYLEKIRKIKIPLPSRSEQEKIADIIYTGDRKLELERKEKKKLEKIKQGLMDLLLTGKIRVKVN